MLVGPKVHVKRPITLSGGTFSQTNMTQNFDRTPNLPGEGSSTYSTGYRADMIRHTYFHKERYFQTGTPSLTSL